MATKAPFRLKSGAPHSASYGRTWRHMISMPCSSRMRCRPAGSAAMRASAIALFLWAAPVRWCAASALGAAVAASKGQRCAAHLTMTHKLALPMHAASNEPAAADVCEQ